MVAARRGCGRGRKSIRRQQGHEEPNGMSKQQSGAGLSHRVQWFLPFGLCPDGAEAGFGLELMLTVTLRKSRKKMNGQRAQLKK
jgi:hypothetical protein